MLHGDISNEQNPTLALDIDLVYRIRKVKTLFGDDTKKELSPFAKMNIGKWSDYYFVVLLKSSESEYPHIDRVSARVVEVFDLQSFRNFMDIYNPVICLTKLTALFGCYKNCEGYVDDYDAWRKIRAY